MPDAAADRLSAVARDAAATRAETRRLAKQVSKLSADSFRVSGRLANIERQINGITGSIKKHAEEAAAAAVAKAMPAKAKHDSPFDHPAPIVSPPDTTLPRLSLLVPPAPGSAKPLTVERIKPAPMQDVTVTSAIKTKPKVEAKMEAKTAAKSDSATEAKSEAQTEAKSEAKSETKTSTEVDPDALAAEAVKRSQELKAEVAAELKAGSAAKGQIAPVSPLAFARKPEQKAKLEPKAAPAAATKVASAAAPPQRRIVRSRWSSSRRGYGVDLGSADSVTVVKAQWAAVKANFGPMLIGMHPTAVRDRRLLSGGSFRLVVGRLRSLKSAERLCARFAKQKVSCRPIQFDGERIVWK